MNSGLPINKVSQWSSSWGGEEAGVGLTGCSGDSLPGHDQPPTFWGAAPQAQAKSTREGGAGLSSVCAASVCGDRAWTLEHLHMCHIGPGLGLGAGGLCVLFHRPGQLRSRHLQMRCPGRAESCRPLLSPGPEQPQLPVGG
jgi:hypothetical protein